MAVMEHSELLVDFWEVGQGDCSVIHLPNGELIIIDVGPIGSPVVDWLSRPPHKKIHSIILTHNDSDHVGALTSLIKCCYGRIGILYVMADRPVKDPGFRHLFRKAEEARKNGGIKNILRLEAPLTLWKSKQLDLVLDVKHPTISGNMLSNNPNATSAIIMLTSSKGESIIWAGDTTITNVSKVSSDVEPICMLGPHHGAPTDRRNVRFSNDLSTIKPRTVVASVGTSNPHEHPAVSYIKHVCRSGANFYCTQLTKRCHKLRPLHHVCKGSALLGLPQVSTGFSCRGTIRLTFNGEHFVSDDLSNRLHAKGISNLSRPKCLRYK